MYTSNLQIKLLRVLGHLGTSDKQASDNMYSVVAESMRRGNTGHTIGNAIVYEAVRTIASIYPNPSLLQSGGDCYWDAERISEADCSYILKHAWRSVPGDFSHPKNYVPGCYTGLRVASCRYCHALGHHCIVLGRL